MESEKDDPGLRHKYSNCDGNMQPIDDVVVVKKRAGAMGLFGGLVKFAVMGYHGISFWPNVVFLAQPDLHDLVVSGLA